MKCINCGDKRIACEADRFVCLNCGQAYPKEYWFISHSHLDIEKVRIVRDVIEEIFFYEPILFFLKCLSDENEITDLIKREINARIWFVYCDSFNARRSQYVRHEVEYINKLIDMGYSKKLITIDLDKFQIWQRGCKKYVREQIFKSLRKDKIFVMPTSDFSTARLLYDELSYRGYKIYFERMYSPDFFAAVRQTIERTAADDGLIIAPIDRQTLLKEGDTLEAIRRDSAAAIDARAAILPLLIAENKDEEEDLLRRFRDVMPQLSNKNYVLFDKSDPISSFEKLEKMLKFFYYQD